ncbi:MAG: hypothetical protein QNK37_07235 [Acidobacteriota bacterium]|nr:hypothetical protein [Acidobacteriota bacterium]
MITVEDFEGVAGFRWGALFDNLGALSIAGRAPLDMEKKLGLVCKVLIQGTFQFKTSDLVFENGKVLIRRGTYGMLLLFCDDHANVSMINAIVNEDPVPGGGDVDSQVSSSKKVEPSDPGMSVIHSTSLANKPIPPEIIDELLDIYTTFLGPLARALAKKQCKARGLDPDHVPAREWFKLLNALADRITDTEKHEDFLDRAVMLKTRF